MKKTYVFLLLLVGILETAAQSPLTSGFFNNHLTDRYEIVSGKLTTDIFTGIKPYRRDRVAQFAQGIQPTTRVDHFNKKYILQDNSLFVDDTTLFVRKPLLKHFYANERALFQVNESRFKLMVNPVLGFVGGTNQEDSLPIYRNSRGVEVFGSLGNAIGFYSYALENQVRFPGFLREQHAGDFSVPGTTLAKDYKNQGRDFFNAAGYITASPIEEVTVQFGHDRNFIGNGYRSLILSDYATPNTFLKLNTNVWKLNYMNLYSVHTDYQGYTEKAPTARKFSALHHLSINFGKNLTIGLWENVVFDRQDSTESRGFEVDYLNPIVFYRAVEHGLNSSDNMILGMDWKWNFLQRFSFYGQLAFDEFVKDDFFYQKNSFANKWAYQAGLKYINIAGVKNLDLQTEINRIRPHMYQHDSRSQNWIHHNQSLAHPLGANLREILAILRYQPAARLTLTAMYSSSIQGIDTSRTSANFGGDITRSVRDQLQPGELVMFQGIKNTVTNLSLDVNYMLWHNLFLDAGVFIRNQQNAVLSTDRNTVIFRFGMRLNLAQTDYRQ